MIGQIVCSAAGSDKGKFSVVVKIEEQIRRIGRLVIDAEAGLFPKRRIGVTGTAIDIVDGNAAGIGRVNVFNTHKIHAKSCHNKDE